MKTEELHIHVHEAPAHCCDCNNRVLYDLVDMVAALRSEVQQVTRGIQMNSKELQALEERVTENTEVDKSAILLLNGLATKIESMKDNPAKLQALADQIKASSADLAAAVTANTPADDSPEEPA